VAAVAAQEQHPLAVRVVAVLLTQRLVTAQRIKDSRVVQVAHSQVTTQAVAAVVLAA
jgi:hypothetical protein